MTTRSTKALSALGAAWMVAAAPAMAAGPDADARIKELERKLERSMQMIEALQGEVQTLKAAKAGEAPAAAAAAAATAVNAEQSAKIENLERQVAQLGGGLSARATDDGVGLHGFADVGLSRSGENNPVYGRGNKGFNLGSFDLYLTPKFGTNVRSLIELVFEIDRTGAVNTDLERLQIGYAFNDGATAWLGRFHTPYGYWNTAYHHGAQIQTSVLRPRFLDFEDKGGILPAHTTGAWATGTFHLGGGKLGYDAYLGNASHIDAGGTLDMKMAGDAKYRTMGGVNAWYSPKALSALRLGVHGLRGTVEADAGNAVPGLTRLNMYGGYGVFLDDDWEALAEYYRFDNTNLTGGTGSHLSSAWYAQLGRSFGSFTPYGRIERTSLDQADNYFAQQANGRSYNRSVIGLRYEVDPKSALKVELNRTKKDLGAGVADDGYNEAYIQYSIRF